MRIVKKESLQFIDGYIVDNDSNVVNQAELVRQFNELNEISKFNQFVLRNKRAIEQSGEQVEYDPSNSDEYMEIPETPLANERQAEQAAIEDEAQGVALVHDFNRIIGKFRNLLNFVSDENILITGTATTEKFAQNPLELTEERLVSILKVSLETRELRLKVTIKS